MASAFQRNAFQHRAFQIDESQVYGGVGHYLEELRAARKLKAITRVPPKPFVTRLPALRPYMPTQPAQMPDWSVLSNPDAITAQYEQAALEAQQAEQMAQRKRREAQNLELLLLAA